MQENKSTELFSSAAIVQENKSTELFSSVAIVHLEGNSFK